MSTEDEADHTRRIQHLLQTGQKEQYESVRMRKDGNRFSVTIKVFPIRSADGEIIGLSQIQRDLTQQKRTEQMLARDSLLLSNVRDSVIVTDTKGIVTYWNEGATRLFGWAADEMLGQPLIERFPESERPWIAQTIQQIAGNREWKGEYQDWRKDGSRVWIDARVTRIVERDGQVRGVMGISHDITERKEAEEAQRERAPVSPAGRNDTEHGLDDGCRRGNGLSQQPGRGKSGSSCRNDLWLELARLRAS